MANTTWKLNRRVQVADRREFRNMPEVPFVDSNGEMVAQDRRITPDRRLNNIHDEWHETQDTDTA